MINDSEVAAGFTLVTPRDENDEAPKYTEFFSWGSDKFG